MSQDQHDGPYFSPLAPWRLVQPHLCQAPGDKVVGPRKTAIHGCVQLKVWSGIDSPSQKGLFQWGCSTWNSSGMLGA
ncbi:hypothetical protein SRHO_G00051090 [Serrasalmus rhombeus]